MADKEKSNSTKSEGEIDYDIEMRNWREAVRGILPEEFNFIPHNTFLKILRVVFLRVFRGWTVKDALEDVGLSEPTYYRERYKDFRKWLLEKAGKVRGKLEAGQGLREALPTTAKNVFASNLAEEYLELADKAEEWERGKEKWKRKYFELRGEKKSKGEIAGEEEEEMEEVKEIAEKEKIKEAYERWKAGGSFVASEEWNKYLEGESEKE